MPSARTPGHRGTCSDCGLPVLVWLSWDGRTVSLTVGTYHIDHVTNRHRWRTSAELGLAFSRVPTGYCHVDHAVVCPAAEPPSRASMREIQQRLAAAAETRAAVPAAVHAAAARIRRQQPQVRPVEVTVSAPRRRQRTDLALTASAQPRRSA